MGQQPGVAFWRLARMGEGHDIRIVDRVPVLDHDRHPFGEHVGRNLERVAELSHVVVAIAPMG